MIFVCSYFFFFLLLKECLNVKSLETFQVRLDQALGTLIKLWCPCALQASWTRWPLEVPSNCKDCMT